MTLHCAAPQACRFKPIYHLLVTLYFFRHVSIDRDFVADFAHPIDGTLAAFLQVEISLFAPSLCPSPAPSPSPSPSPPQYTSALGPCLGSQLQVPSPSPNPPM